MGGTVPFWMPLVAAAMAAAAALAGALINPLFQRRTTKEERVRAKRSLLLQKAEEIFMEMARLRGVVHRLGVWAIQANYPTREEQAASAPNDPFDTARLRALLKMYFPASNAIFEDHEREFAKVADRFWNAVPEARDGTGRGDPDFGTFQIELNALYVALLDRLERLMADQVETLL